MGHRSSKISAGLTNGNKSSIKETSSSAKLSKHSSRRYSSRFPKSSSHANRESSKIYKNSSASLTSTSVTAVYGEKFLPLLRLDSDSIAESSNLSSVASNTSGQIIIKIHFKTHSPSEMDNAQQNILQPTTESHAQSMANSDTYRRLMDTNSNKMPHTDAGVVEAAGSSINSMLNNNNANINSESLPDNLNALCITEPLVEQEVDPVGKVEYYEVTEENTATTHNRPPVTSRRQKAKSAFMNLKSMLESSSSSSSSKSQLNKLSNSNNNNQSSDNSSNHSRNTSQSPPVSDDDHIRHKQSRPSSNEVRMSLPKTSSSSCHRDSAIRNVNSITTSTSHTPTPVSITTSSAMHPRPTVTATNDQLAVWASNKDLIISSINVVVCPTTTTLATATTSKSSDREPAAEIGNGIRNESGLVVEEKCSSNQQRTFEGLSQQTNMSQTSNAKHVLSTATSPIVHSQVDFVHYLVPDLQRIFNSSFYWGKMDRYEAERLLEGKPEGTFLLRDSAQEEYLFSVTFRKYGRSLHARIEQSGHKFR